MRVIDIQMAGGFTARILPDRGLDISTAWSHGVPIGWMSKVGEVAPLARADGMAWIERFTGGLLTTCGPDNIGVPSVDGDESLGLHGSWTFLRATDVHVSRERVDGELMVDITGTLRQTHALGRNIEIKRLVRLLSGQSVIAVMDEITNLGSSAEPMPMLYHVNIGAPLWSAGATIEYPPETTLIPRNSNAAANVAVASVGPEPIRNGEEYVFERVVSGGDTVPVIVRNPALGLKLSLTWSRSSLPRFHQWIHLPVPTARPNTAPKRAAAPAPLTAPAVSAEPASVVVTLVALTRRTA